MASLSASTRLFDYLIGLARRQQVGQASPNMGKGRTVLLGLSGQNKSFTIQPKYGIYITVMAKPCNTQQAAKAVSVSMMTLHRWIVGAKVKAPKLRIRNGRAVRLVSTADLAELRKPTRAMYYNVPGQQQGY